MAASGVYSRAFRDYRPIFILAALYGVGVLAQAFFLGAGVLEILQYCAVNFSGVIMASVIFLLLSYICKYTQHMLTAPVSGFDIVARHRFTDRAMDDAMDVYCKGAEWRYAMIGILILVANSFFSLQKAMIPIWIDYSIDPAVAAFEKALHFGYYPHEPVVRMVDALGMSKMIDTAYVYWFPVMYTAIGYALFFEKNVHLRLKFMWVWVLSWIVLGSVMAAMMTATGPIFFHLFYTTPNPYADLLAHITAMEEHNTYFMTKTRALLQEWTMNDKIVDPNAIVAIPSLHIGICLLVSLYAHARGSVFFVPSVIFAALVFLATIYFGVHYAIDAYISIVGVFFFWWLIGKILDRKYPRPVKGQDGR